RFDFGHLEADRREQAIRDLAQIAARTPFDLAKGPLFLIHLVKAADKEHILIFNMHHIVSDGWSMGILIKEFVSLYRAFLVDERSPLPELTLQYADFAAWQRQWLQGQVLELQLGFWKETLGQDLPVLHLPTDRPRPPVQTFNGDSVTTVFPLILQKSVQEFCRKQGVTPFMFLLAVFQTLMARYSGQQRFAIGTPIANRTTFETEALIGFFVNTLVLPVDLSDNPDFAGHLRQVRETTLNAYAHQDVPFEQLVEALQPERDLSHSPLFQVAFMLQNTPLQTLQLPGVSLSPVSAESKTAKYDLTVTTAETDEGLLCSFEYNVDLFDRSTVERMVNHFRRLVEAALGNPRQRVADLPLMTDDEKQRQLIEWNHTTTPYPDHHSVHALFEEWAATQPDAPAVVFHDQCYSYDELNRRANQLARHLQKQGANVEQIIGISMRRCADVAVAALAILKCGAAFLNIDPTYPRDRLTFMLEDSGISVLITQKMIAENLPIHQAATVLIDDWSKIAGKPVENLHVPISADNAAYVIYTSGSTGRPKGTVLSHRGLCNLHRAQRRAFHVTPNCRVLQFAPLSFDASVWETVMALLNGACLVYADQEELTSGQGLRDVLKTQQVNIVTLPPSVLSVMPFDDLPQLQTIVTAGEACSLELVKRWGADRQYVNAYGPTETTVCASYYEANVDDEKAPPIGRPLQNFQLYILDWRWSPVAVGVPGELCIGGVGLARGYHHRADQTADKFIPNPFTNEVGARLYRTGDLARYRPDGNIEFLGRIDHQVKVRGFRVELGEIEAGLAAQPEVKDVVVLARQDFGGENRIVAYVVCESTIAAAELKQRLRR
ncbi:MAG: amino acid adenylation domain-containing protein, partial [Calditrichaeota bacterium]